jgi:hypothetical protein
MLPSPASPAAPRAHHVCGTDHRDEALRTRMRSRIVDRARPALHRRLTRLVARERRGLTRSPRIRVSTIITAQSRTPTTAPATCRRQRRPSTPRGCRRVPHTQQAGRGEPDQASRAQLSQAPRQQRHCAAQPPHPWPQQTAARAHSRARCPCKKLRRKRAPRRRQDRPLVAAASVSFGPRTAPPEQPRPAKVVTSQLQADFACPAPVAGSATTSRSTSLVRSASAYVSLAPVAAGQRRAPPPPRHRYQRTPRARQWSLRLRTKLPLSQLWSTRIVAP